MTLTHIAVFILVALLCRLLAAKKASGWIIMLSSLVFIYWLQPVSTIRSLEFWLPTTLIFLSILVWGIVSPKGSFRDRENLWSVAVSILVIIAISLLRYFNLGILSGLINPPAIQLVLIYGLVAAGLVWSAVHFAEKNRITALAGIIFLLVLFVLLKYPPLVEKTSYFLRTINGQSLSLAHSQEIVWVGYSYFAFRLIHVLREWQQGRAMEVKLPVFISYGLFFPAFTAGPIERVERFQKEFKNREKSPVNEDFLEGGVRIIKGLFYKFILADSLALFSLNSTNAVQVDKTVWMWVLVYTYALRLYFDFSGYSDLAIGISRLMGIHMPENFKRPYLAKNLSLFWNSWHITLTQWFRTYYFNPVNRYMRSKKKISAGLIILFTQTTTMLLIGLWHGMALNFILWGLWNGVGMFIQNRWSEWRKKHAGPSNPNSVSQHILDGASIFLTFNFISLGWIWFAMPDVGSSLAVFARLFGGA